MTRFAPWILWFSFWTFWIKLNLQGAELSFVTKAFPADKKCFDSVK